MNITVRNIRSGFTQNLDNKDFAKWPADLKSRFEIVPTKVEKPIEVKEVEKNSSSIQQEEQA